MFLTWKLPAGTVARGCDLWTSWSILPLPSLSYELFPHLLTQFTLPAWLAAHGACYLRGSRTPRFNFYCLSRETGPFNRHPSERARMMAQLAQVHAVQACWPELHLESAWRCKGRNDSSCHLTATRVTWHELLLSSYAHRHKKKVKKLRHKV